MVSKRLNGQDYVRDALGDAFEKQNRASSGFAAIDETTNFCSNPREYEWACRANKEILVPFNCELGHDFTQPLHSPGMRWEKHRVWIVEGILRRGESNLLAMRRFYLHEDSWLILLGEGYDRAGIMTKCYMLSSEVASTGSNRGRWYSMNDSGP